MKYERDQGVPGSSQRVAREGTKLAIEAYDTKVPECDNWKVTVDLLRKSNPHYDALTHPTAPTFTITVLTTSQGWFGEPGSQRVITMLHEWYHVVEFSLFDCESCSGARLLEWLIEGAAVYESYRTADADGIADYGSLREYDLRLARTAHTSLQSMESHVKTGRHYSVSFLATEYLVRSAGPRALLDYWREIGQTAKGNQAFQHAFGISLTDFYRRFRAYRKRGFTGS